MNPVQQIDAGLADRLREGEISRVDLIEQILDDEVERHGHEDMGIETLEIARRIDDALKSAAVSAQDASPH
ncbi:Uncharacterised protein [Mycobacteroides abscessus subsp. bolletii]|uniref:hypothetical protein n=1 Tax=Mycobacteroides abscessus TaxID=36809 RepID=UPI0009A7D57D|nr:hypothetical protein [Mycobacteroides abscessus]SKU94413.1 Uncharacterised protein [Mycobacteroides abscessus subsp. bolletii]